LLDLASGEQKKPEFLAINPMGRVPALVDGDYKIWESGAILLYLADKYGGVNTPEARGIMSQWVLFANASLALGLFLEDRREKEMPRLLAPLEAILQQQEYIAGNSFSVADVAVGSYLGYGRLMLNLTYAEYPAVQAYLDRIGARPAYQKSIVKP
jgi:glutathione S-transferase